MKTIFKRFACKRYVGHESRSPSTKIHLVGVAALLGAASVLGAAMLPESAQAISIGKYRLGNHPAGGVATPHYGLRLDGLLTGDSKDVYTFDFRDVSLKYDGADIFISGSVYGGLDTGSTYDPNQSGLWDVRFKYKNVTTAGNGLVANRGGGFIRSRDFAKSRGKFRLKSFKGAHNNAFSLKTGHRGVSGYSGFGWMNHFPTDGGPGGDRKTHLYSSDWLFTAKPVPEPTTILATLLAAGGAQVMNRKRKRLAQKAAKHS